MRKKKVIISYFIDILSVLLTLVIIGLVYFINNGCFITVKNNHEIESFIKQFVGDNKIVVGENLLKYNPFSQTVVFDTEEINVQIKDKASNYKINNIHITGKYKDKKLSNKKITIQSFKVILQNKNELCNNKIYTKCLNNISNLIFDQGKVTLRKINNLLEKIDEDNTEIKIATISISLLNKAQLLDLAKIENFIGQVKKGKVQASIEQILLNKFKILSTDLDIYQLGGKLAYKLSIAKTIKEKNTEEKANFGMVAESINIQGEYNAVHGKLINSLTIENFSNNPFADDFLNNVEFSLLKDKLQTISASGQIDFTNKQIFLDCINLASMKGKVLFSLLVKDWRKFEQWVTLEILNGTYSNNEIFSKDINNISGKIEVVQNNKITSDSKIIAKFKDIRINQTSLQGFFSLNPKSSRLYGELDFKKNISIKDVIGFWPKFFIAISRTWVKNYVLKGQLYNTKFYLDTDDKDLLKIKFNLRDAVVKYISSYPAILIKNSRATLNTKFFKATVIDAKMGGMKLFNSDVTVPLTYELGKTINYDIRAKGKISNFLDFLYLPYIDLYNEIKIKPSDIKGNFTSYIKLSHRNELNVDPKSIKASGSVDYNIKHIAKYSPLKLTLNDVTGSVNFNDKLVDVLGYTNWLQSDFNFQYVRNILNKNKSFLIAKGIISTPLINNFTSSFNKVVSSPTPFTLSIDGYIENFNSMFIKLDLRESYLNLPLVPLAISPNEKSFLIFDLWKTSLKKNNPTYEFFTSYNAKNATFVAKGNVISEDGFNKKYRLQNIVIENFIIDSYTDLSATICNKNNQVEVFFKMKYLFIHRLLSNFLGDKKLFKFNYPVKLFGKINKVYNNNKLVEDVIVTSEINDDIDLLLSINDKDFDKKLTADAKENYQQKSPALSLVIKSKKKLKEFISLSIGKKISIKSNGLGNFLNLFTEKLIIDGGKVETIEIPESSKQTVIVSDFTVKDAPILTNLFTIGSLEGLANLLSNKGIVFTKAKFDFEKMTNKFILSQGKIVGPSVGITFDGYITTDDGINISGSITPVYWLNSFFGYLPFVGKLLASQVGEGIFALKYNIKTNEKNNIEITINPVSFFIPGIFRRIFDNINIDHSKDDKFKDKEVGSKKYNQEIKVD